MTHIEEHIGFEGFLVILDEFDEEAAEKYTDEEDPEYQSGAIACTTFPVHIHEQPENSEVTQCFIDLRRVRRFGEDGLCSVSMPHTHIFDKSESPRQRGCMTVAITAAGWDPGSDSIVRALMQAAAPKGITYTNFGPGMSMGHTVAVKAVEGVNAALSMTIPLGTGIHRRMVYIELKDGYKFDDVAKAIKSDPYFANDETHVMQVECVNDLLDMGHGVHMIRKGVSGKTQNQILEFNMKINNPALTAQILVGVARASFRQQPGCYTMIEIPVIDMLYGEREDLIKHLV